MDNPSGNNLEKELIQLAKEVSEKRGMPEYEKLSERELVKETLGPLINQASPSGSSAAVSDSRTATISLDDLSNLPAEAKIQVEKLVESVFKEGLENGVKNAKKSDAFVLDAFHDALTDKFYEELKKRKLI
ncbi:MAG: hypothetical protein AAB820_01670 [Patescibacteria group bacterium]